MPCKCGHGIGQHYPNEDETEFFECLAVVGDRKLCPCKKYEEAGI